MGARFILCVAGAVALGAVVFMAPQVSAQSVVWSVVQPDLIAPGADGPDRPVQYLFDPMVTIAYSVLVSEVDAAGTKIRTIPNGASVSKGSRVLFEFMPHDYRDIYWFGSGGSMGSPYGDWTAPGTYPSPAERCTPKNLYATNVPKNGNPFVDQYAALAVETPVKNIRFTGVSADCTEKGSARLCVMNEAGMITAAFAFATTTGRFYPGQVKLENKPVNGYCPKFSRSIGDSYYMDLYGGPDNSPTSRSTMGKYVLTMPPQKITFTLDVADNDSPPPSAPTLAVTGGASCMVGTPHTISMTASDPRNTPIRYAIDWDQNGTIDQYSPSSGYVSSGTTQMASRTYSTAGLRGVRVMTLNAAGFFSEWRSLAFECAETPVPAMVTCTDSTDSDDDDYGSTCTEDSGYTEYGIPEYFPVSSQSLLNISIRAVPSLVRPGETTRVHWSADGVSTCTVTGDNGDAWEGIMSPVAGVASQPIEQQTRYTLSCLDPDGEVHTKSAPVHPLPSWTEQ